MKIGSCSIQLTILRVRLAGLWKLRDKGMQLGKIRDGAGNRVGEDEGRVVGLKKLMGIGP